MSGPGRGWALAVAAALAAVGAASAQDAAEPRSALRVCQDPNNLPFSNLAGEGIENRIAELFGRSLGLPVTYYSFPQRMAFIRNTLKFKLPGEDYRCDLVIGVPFGYDQVSFTRPYYRSTYALVFARGRGLDQVRSGADFLALDPALLARLRIGVFDRSPASEWLNRHGLVAQGVPYPMLNADPADYPGEIVERDLAAGKIDVAVVWGPIAGFFARRVRTPELSVVALRSEPGVQFEYPISMGVRYGETAWKRQIEDLIEARRPEIEAILRDYGVPLIEAGDAAARP